MEQVIGSVESHYEQGAAHWSCTILCVGFERSASSDEYQNEDFSGHNAGINNR